MGNPSWHIIPEKSETILWQGKPQRRCGVAPWWVFHVAALVFWALLLWGLTGPVPQAAEGFHDWATHPFCRTIMLILAGVATAAPFLAARSTNGSSYVVTDRRIVIRKPLLGGGSYPESFPYERVYSSSVRPMEDGLACFRFDACSKGKTESTQELLYAIPRLVAEDVEKLAARGRR